MDNREIAPIILIVVIIVATYLIIFTLPIINFSTHVPNSRLFYWD